VGLPSQYTCTYSPHSHVAEDALGEGAAISFTECTHSFDNQSSCGVNDTILIYNAVANKGAAVAVGSGDAPSYIEFHRCVVDNSTTGWPFEDDPQGEGGAFSLGSGTTLVLEDCLITNNYAGKKVSCDTFTKCHCLSPLYGARTLSSQVLPGISDSKG